MDASTLLIIFLGISALQTCFEFYLALINQRYVQNPEHQRHAQEALNIEQDDMQKSLSYGRDKARFGMFSSLTQALVSLLFIAYGGLGIIETAASQLQTASGLGGGELVTGLVFFALIGLISTCLQIPFGIYSTFVIEEKHGFNRQTLKGFLLDTIKGLILGSVLGGILLTALLYVMQTFRQDWWWMGWLIVSGFSLLSMWIYPSLLAPLFNTFKPLEDGPLKDSITALAKKVSFRTDGLFVMNASIRSSHGNAYFTGMFGAKRIVLFDTLLETLSDKQVVAVLAHELGHFRLNHIRKQLIRSMLFTGGLFFAMNFLQDMGALFDAFGLSTGTAYGTLLVFSLWFGLLDFVIQPLSSWVSRKYEFEADAFAKQHIGSSKDLAEALLTLRKKSSSVPLCHPMFSRFYHSHPPILERLQAMRYI